MLPRSEHLKAEPRVVLKEFFLFWSKDVEENPIANKSKFHDYYIQNEN